MPLHMIYVVGRVVSRFGVRVTLHVSISLPQSKVLIQEDFGSCCQ